MWISSIEFVNLYRSVLLTNQTIITAAVSFDHLVQCEGQCRKDIYDKRLCIVARARYLLTGTFH